ncbi:hypothetical protein BS47DRAFT_952789 [Hydnum rufescens UP504]|uniref:Uncharacterized protein n=1 Tax=Hydnum rufescens UP504 TaxID=1448309 RepID=A0A9P6AX15_9AGAM|nr:hypothetical protein BS47DRAFT_952789 [Hydnum rufescens UP504]
MLSVWVQVFRRERRIKRKTWDDFELVLFEFCFQNPGSRKYFLESDALFHVRDVLMRRPQSPRLIAALYFMTTTESVDDLHDRLISCGVLIPLSRCLALTNFDNKYMSLVPEIFLSVIEHRKGVHLLRTPILSYLARSLNHPFVAYAN